MGSIIPFSHGPKPLHLQCYLLRIQTKLGYTLIREKYANLLLGRVKMADKEFILVLQVENYS